MELKEFTEKDIVRTMYEGKESNIGLVCIIPLSKLKEPYRQPKFQLFRLLNGFGCFPDTTGNACLGYFCADKEHCRWERYNIIGIGNEDVQKIGTALEAEYQEKRRT